MLATSSRNDTILGATQNHRPEDNTARFHGDASKLRQNALKRFYKSKSSNSSDQSAPSNRSSRDKSDKKKTKKKSKPPAPSDGNAHTINESVNFSSASSSGYNSHINPVGERNFSQHLYHNYPEPQPTHYHHHDQPTQMASLPAMEDGGGGFESFGVRRPAQLSWRRSVSLRAPMVPMMIDDEVELIDDNIDGDNINSGQHHNQRQHPQYPYNYQQQQQQQHHFLLADDTDQCVDSTPSYHLYQNHHQLPEPPQQYCGPTPMKDDEDDHQADDDNDGANQYSQVRRPAGSAANQDHHNYLERISHLQQKQQQMMLLANALRHQQRQFATAEVDQQRSGLNSKSTFSLTGEPKQQSTLASNYPVAIYHQPNLNFNNSQTQPGKSQSYKQARDLQRRYQPTPFSQVNNSSPQLSLSGARSLSLVVKERKLAARNRQSISAGSQGATDSSGATLVGTPSEPVSSDSSNISPVTSTSHHLKSRGSLAAGGANKMQASASGNRLHPSNYQQQQQHSSNRNKSPLSSQSSRKKPAKSPPPPPEYEDSDGTGQAKLGFCGKFAKLLLFISNILFWSAGIALGAWGILSLVDDHKYNLSQLLVFEPNSKMSLFQLLSWSFITLGCATILVGFCGCSAIFKNNRWILGLYIFLILAIFALDLATGLLAMIFQERLVANVRLRLANKLRSDYGVQASFTAAIDYIQTKYECCGLEGHFDYDQSLWRLQRLGGFEATVARTCCHLRNTFDDQAHVNPRPVNESMCQSNDVRFHQSYRYRKGCLDDLERLVRQKIWTFTMGCGAVGGVILLSLLFATCFCRSIPSAGGSRKSSSQQQQALNYHHESGKKQSGGFILNQPHQTTNAQQQHQRHYHR